MRAAAHGGAETLLGLNEIHGAVVRDHGNRLLPIVGVVQRDAYQGTKTREQTAMAVSQKVSAPSSSSRMRAVRRGNDGD
jgi:hypothetical protein